MSKKKLLLVGAGGFGRMVAEQAMLQYDCAFVDDGQDVDTEICGIPVVGGLADLRELRKEYGLLVVAMLFRTSLLPMLISVHTPSWAVAVWCCKTLAFRTVHPLVTVFC
mgnify:CR=1 FL=1